MAKCLFVRQSAKICIRSSVKWILYLFIFHSVFLALATTLAQHYYSCTLSSSVNCFIRFQLVDACFIPFQSVFKFDVCECVSMSENVQYIQHCTVHTLPTVNRILSVLFEFYASYYLKAICDYHICGQCEYPYTEYRALVYTDSVLQK